MNYVYSPNADFIGPLKNTLPSFWSNELSNIFAIDIGENESIIVPARKSTIDERVNLAKELYRNNHSIGHIAVILSVSRSSISGRHLLSRLLYTQEVAGSSPAPPTFFLDNQEMGSINNCKFLNYNDVLISYPGP